MWLLISILVFCFARWICGRFHSPLANPLLISVFILISMLLLLHIPYETYAADNHIVNLLLQPAVVALAYPLYEQLHQIRLHWKIVLLACLVGSALSMMTASVIAVYFHADMPLVAAILTKSVTTPIAMAVTSQLGGEPAIAAILVLLVGLFGAMFAYPIYQRLNIRHPLAKGLTMGTVSHALGTASCLEKSPQDAAFSSLALVLCGVITSVFAPVFYGLALWLHQWLH